MSHNEQQHPEPHAPTKPPGAAPIISALVIVRNGAARLIRAVESIRDQTRAVDQLVIVVDGSTDDTARIARSIDGAEVHESDQRLGIAQARNLGISRCEGDWVTFLDHDDLWRADKTERQLALVSESDALVCTGLVALFAESTDSVSINLRAQLDLPPRVGLTPSALMVRRSYFDTIGGFDMSLQIGCDSDWVARADRKSWAVVDRVVVDKELHMTNISSDTRLNGQEMFVIARRQLERQRSRGG